MDYHKQEVLKKAFGIAAAFVGWLFIVLFIVIGLGYFTVQVLGWDNMGAGILFFFVGMILFIAPPVIIAFYVEDHGDED